MTHFSFALRRTMFKIEKYKENWICAVIVGVVLYFIL
ncbi:hypothetical protein 65p228 [Aeromonas phage 65]|uniref:Uncharacterized protein n=1 Tax=Aeromonas phage 65 TaxID=2919549 RepID=E5DS62_9CAUD|nr:hypothetical protein ST65p228 [Aeromonas phage 65]ADQ53236.1 hypothetical protein 65p228 [Aeromonas phage 65]